MKAEDHQIRRLRRTRAYDELYIGKQPDTHVEDRWSLHDYAAEHVGSALPVTYLEFGVFDGKSLNRWGHNLKNPASTLTGFDSFLGLPEEWDVGFTKFDRGSFSTAGQPPSSADARVSFVKGWFQNTLPGFLDKPEPPFKDRVVVHFDADLYSSTLFLLTSLWPRIPEYYFVMDDFMQDDVIALHDFTMAYPVELEWIADRLGPNGFPFQTFGKMRRVLLDLDGTKSS